MELTLSEAGNVYDQMSEKLRPWNAKIVELKAETMMSSIVSPVMSVKTAGTRKPESFVLCNAMYSHWNSI